MVMNVKGYAALAVKEDLVPIILFVAIRVKMMWLSIFYTAVYATRIFTTPTTIGAALNIRWYRGMRSLAAWCMLVSR